MKSETEHSSSNRNTALPCWMVIAIGVAFLLVAPTAAQDLPSSCAEIAVCDPAATDGDYFLQTDRGNLPVYCHDMAGQARDYITLVNAGIGYNYGSYGAGGASPGTTVMTHYARIRLDPATLLVHTGDQTFATSSGTLSHSGSSQVLSMPYAVAMACAGGRRAEKPGD